MAKERLPLLKFVWQHKLPLSAVGIGLAIAVNASGSTEATTDRFIPPVAAASTGTSGGAGAADTTPSASPKVTEPPFNAAAGRYNKAHLEGAATCDLNLVRQGGRLLVDATVDPPSLHGVWMSYEVTSQQGRLHGFSTGEDLAVPDVDGIMDGVMPYIHVVENIPYGGKTQMAECSANIPDAQ
jgi:hypothetical protein